MMSKYEDMLDVVNEEDIILRQEKRSQVHEKGLLHREAAVLIVNDKQEILIQTRTCNGKLTYSAAGHLDAGEEYGRAAIRETFEELALRLQQAQIKKLFKHKVDSITHERQNRRFITVFEAKVNVAPTNLKIKEDEVKSIQFIKIPELKKMMAEQPQTMTSGLLNTLKIYFKL